MEEQHGEVVTGLDVTQHEERDEDDPQSHQDRKPQAVFVRLERNTATSTTGTDKALMTSINNNTVTLFLFPTDTVNTQMYGVCVYVQVTLAALVHACKCMYVCNM